MPHIGFYGSAVGLGVSRSWMLLAVDNRFRVVDNRFRVFEVSGWGGAVNLAITSFRSVVEGGSRIPDVDTQNRPFPNNLAGKTLGFTVAAGISFGGAHGVTIKVQSLSGSQPVLYEWDGRLEMTSTCVGGFELEGTASRYADTLFLSESDMYGNLMHHGTGAEDRLRRAVDRANERRREQASRRVLHIDESGARVDENLRQAVDRLNARARTAR